MPEQPTRIQILQAALEQAKAKLADAEDEAEYWQQQCWHRAGRLAEAVESLPAPATSVSQLPIAEEQTACQPHQAHHTRKRMASV